MCICLNNVGKYCDIALKIIIKKIIFSGEAHFDLGGHVNKQDCSVLEHRKTARRGIIGPYFFENEQQEAVTIIGDRYPAMYNLFLFTKIEEENIGNIWFQQDGAMCHTA